MIKKEIFQSQISIGSYDAVLDEVFRTAGRQPSSYVCFANVHMVIEAYRDPEFRKVVNEANIVTADGKPLSVFLRMFYGIKQDRICGMDVLPDILSRAEKENKSVYFYGTTEEILEAIRRRVQTEFPQLVLKGTYSPPFRILSAEEKQNIISQINSAAPDFLFVALGCPKQEKWMAEHRGKINSCMLGLGQAFHVYAGKEKRLPKWMRALALEWAFRLFLEPGRLWKRYLVTNSIFLFLTFRQLIGKVFPSLTPVANKITNS
jgi:N-acetylglucosaminyldiphosphoundecaprenol N-acetyl-beta-D-mannosaminyltransferase